MALLVSAKINYDMTKRQLNAKEFEQTLVQRSYKELTTQISDLKSSVKDQNALKQNTTYQKLEAYATTYELRGDNLKTQISVLSAQADNYKDLMKKGVEESTSMWCFK